MNNVFLHRRLIFSVACTIYSTSLLAQIGSASDMVSVSANTEIFVDGLALVPSDDFLFENNSLRQDLSSSPEGYKVFTFDRSVSFRGKIGIMRFNEASNVKNDMKKLLYSDGGNTQMAPLFSNEAVPYRYSTLENHTRLDMVTIGSEKQEGYKFTKERAISSYPNPVREKLHMQVSGPEQPVSVRLISQSGQVLLNLNETKATQEIDFRKYDAGLYFIQATYAGGTSLTSKIVKE